MLEFNKQLCDRIFFLLPGLSDTQIGEMIGIKRQSVQGWRKGKSRPTLIQVNTISQRTSVSVRWFMTGKTTDKVSISYVYYPKFYDNNKIKNIKAFSLARDLASTLSYNSYDRNFLPILSFFNTLAYSTYCSKKDYRIIQRINNINDIFANVDCFSNCKVSKNTNELYKCMNTTFLLRNDLLKISLSNNKFDYDAVAYTNFDSPSLNSNKSYKPLEITKQSRIKVYGNDISPAVNNGCILTISDEKEFPAFSPKTQQLVIVEIKVKNITPYKMRLGESILICRYGYRSGENLILSGLKNDSCPYIIEHNDIIKIYTISSIHLNTE